MPKEANSKLRLFHLLEIFRRDTDGEHSLTRRQIEDKLKAGWDMGVDRKTFENDLLCLSTLGVYIDHEENSHSYQLIDRTFTISELKMMIDCLQSSRTLDEATTTRLINGLKKECSRYEAATLDRQIIVANRVKTVNKATHYAIDTIQQAIQLDCQISFKYFDYDIRKKRAYRRKGERYHISPFVLIYSDENHYFLGFNGKNIRVYRVDRMEQVALEQEQPREGKEVFEEKVNLEHYRQYTFGMYDGKIESVQMRFNKRMMNTVIDRFGMEVVPRHIDDDLFEIIVPVAVSPQFFGWVFGLGKQVQIVAPQSVVDRFKKMLEDVGGKNE